MTPPADAAGLSSPPHALAGKGAMIAGATGDLGGALAVALAGEGCRLFLTGRREDGLAELAARLDAGPGGGAGVATWAGDLTGGGAVEDAAAAAEAALGDVDLLVHALGRHHLGDVADTSDAELDAQLAVNLRVPWRLTRRLLPSLARRRGQVVFVASTAARAPRRGVAAYAAAKAALVAFADALRAEVNPLGVRVLTVFPGRTAGALQEELHREEGRPYRPERLLQPQDVARLVVACVALPPTAEVTDVTLRPALPPAP